MTTHQGKGNYINGRFINADEDEIVSVNPAADYLPVFKTKTSITHIDLAVQSAHNALPRWSALSMQDRIRSLMSLRNSFIQKEQQMANVITSEMGKIFSESLAEAKNLSSRINLMADHGIKRVANEEPTGILGETRYHAQGVLAVLGPYNFPAHLVNAHIIPALMTGNTVVVKFSEICPWVGEIYANCVHEANLPAGVFNMVQGKADIGQALVKHPLIHGILFTGSYATGRGLAESVLDEPHKMLALEMGGKNIAVVLKDADLYQALAEITQGAFLTTGQRCTATSRVFVDKTVADRFIDSFIKIVKELKPGDPTNLKTIFGPLASREAKDRFASLLKNAESSGCDILVKSQFLDGGAFVCPSLHLEKGQKATGYLDTELFGPDVCIKIIDDIDEAIKLTNQSAYGLSNAVFTAKKSIFEQYYQKTRSGVLNWNRSTNGAYGEQPFGGVGKSGNQRAAGIDAVRYTTFPVAVNYLEYAQTQLPANMITLLEKEKKHLDISMSTLATRHALEEMLENYQIPINGVRGPSIFLDSVFLEKHIINKTSLFEELSPYISIDEKDWVITLPEEEKLEAFLHNMDVFFRKLHNSNFVSFIKPFASQINIPSSEKLPRSEAMLRRLYRDDFIPKEKKTPVIDLRISKGAYLASIDEDPLIIFDAASQIASLGLGFQADTYLNALAEGDLTNSLLANSENTVESKKWIVKYEQFLLQQTDPNIYHVTFTSSGAEANEKAFDLCRLNGPGGKRILAFEGSFHGRTLMSLQATYNPQKRAHFEFKGYQATFIPFPKRSDLENEPKVTNEWIVSWSKAERPQAFSDDTLLQAEIASLECLKNEIKKGDICAVIVEPMQCEGGENYATSRFFNGLRALTRSLKVPLIFDEVQTGFGLLGPFYAHSHFQLRNAAGKLEGPDCITLAKKAQLGVCLSVWQDSRPATPHVLQIIRGYLQAQDMQAQREFLVNLKSEIEKQTLHLTNEFPNFVLNIRHQGYAFAFDLPSHTLAMQIINQRFYRGFMVYIAGEKTVRFRFNLATTTEELRVFFDNLKRALLFLKNNPNQIAPNWIPPEASITIRNNISESTNENNFAIEILNLDSWSKYQAQIKDLEDKAYEPERRDSMDFLRNFITQKDGLGLILTKKSATLNRILGFAIGGPLELNNIDGPLQDKMRNRTNTFYSANIVVSQELRNQGFGFRLKSAQVNLVRSMKKADGSYRYDFMTGRNRIGFTPEISRINHFFGAYTVAIYQNQYGETGAKTLYYRIPLRNPKCVLVKSQTTTSKQIIDWSSSVQAPLGLNSLKIQTAIEDGMFTSAVGTKLTLSNWVTPSFVRYAELLKHLLPKACQHTYFTSGRDEIVDKGLRALRVSRPTGDVVIGLKRQYVGHTTAAARSISDESDYQYPFAWFDWPKVQHPVESSDAISLTEIRNEIERYSSERILGIVIELIGEKTGYIISDNFLSGLNSIREETSIPLIFVETASAFGRNGKTMFKSDNLTVKPNMIWWYAGAQLGHVFVDHQHYVSTPLTLISTWDGDEVSMKRTYHHLLVAHECLKNNHAKDFEKVLCQNRWSFPRHGQGLWQTFTMPSQEYCQNVIKKAAAAGLQLGKGSNHCIVICPPIDVSKEEALRGLEILNHALS
jgi:succinylglutamate-semialdehyde dehydrogenase